MLEVNNLQTSYGQSQVLFGIDLKINQGEVVTRSEEHTSELQSLVNIVCRLLLEKTNV